MSMHSVPCWCCLDKDYVAFASAYASVRTPAPFSSHLVFAAPLHLLDKIGGGAVPHGKASDRSILRDAPGCLRSPHLRWLVILLMMGFIFISPQMAFSVCGFLDFHLDRVAFDNAINKDCIHYRMEGSCASALCPDCVVVKFWEPRYAVTLVKIPGDRLLSADIFYQALGAQAGQLLINQIGSPRCADGAGGGAHTFNTGNPGSRFYMAKVYSLQDTFSPQCGLCGSNQPAMQLNYLSEADSHWKTAESTTVHLDMEGLLSRLGLPLVLRPLGVWQSLQPIGGHSKHPSHVVSAAIAAARAVWLLTPGARIPPPPATTIPGELSLCFQPGWPLKYPCMPTGTTPTLWGKFHVSPRGKFLYFFWAPRVCCVSSAQAACGAAAAALATGPSEAGGITQNLCDIPGGIGAPGVVGAAQWVSSRECRYTIRLLGGKKP